MKVRADQIVREPLLKAPRFNVYSCEKCGGQVTTVDIHEGVTPFMLKCRVGREGECQGKMYSSFYPNGQIPSHIPAPRFEWFKPVQSEYLKLSLSMKEHVDKGGLDIRPLSQDHIEYVMTAWNARKQPAAQAETEGA